MILISVSVYFIRELFIYNVGLSFKFACIMLQRQLHTNGKKVKVSHSLMTVGAVEVRVPLYLGHS